MEITMSQEEVDQEMTDMEAHKVREEGKMGCGGWYGVGCERGKRGAGRCQEEGETPCPRGRLTRRSTGEEEGKGSILMERIWVKRGAN